MLCVYNILMSLSQIQHVFHLKIILTNVSLDLIKTRSTLKIVYTFGMIFVSQHRDMVLILLQCSQFLVPPNISSSYCADLTSLAIRMTPEVQAMTQKVPLFQCVAELSSLEKKAWSITTSLLMFSKTITCSLLPSL